MVLIHQALALGVGDFYSGEGDTATGKINAQMLVPVVKAKKELDGGMRWRGLGGGSHVGKGAPEEVKLQRRLQEGRSLPGERAVCFAAAGDPTPMVSREGALCKHLRIA